jgi:hypothetical protein
MEGVLMQGPKSPTEDDALVLLAMLGAGLTALGVALGAAEATETLFEKGEDLVNAPKNAMAKVTSLLGIGRKGGLF